MNDDSIALTVIATDEHSRRAVKSIDEFNARPTSRSQEFLVAGPGEDCLDALTAKKFSGLDRGAISILPLVERCEVEADWNDLPPAIAVRCAPLHRQALVAIPHSILESSVNGDAIFRDVSDPLWEWLIRQADGSVRFQIERSLVSSAESSKTVARPRLAPGSPDASRRWLRSLLPAFKFAESSGASADVIALRAGLLQIHDFLDESHEQSQSIEGAGKHAAGDYWHAIMHRREPDYGNSKYWFRRVGRHPLFDELAGMASEILSTCPGGDQWRNRLVGTSGWDPFAFVDLCEVCARDEECVLALAAREIQWQEMRLLIRHTFADAAGSR